MKKVLILLTLILNLTIAENYSLNFEGCDWCDDYVDFGDNLDMGDNSFSYAMWVKMNSVNVDWQQNILSKGITGGGNPSETGYKLSMLPGQNSIKATISSGLDESEGAINIYTEPVEVGDWNHVCVVVDRQTETMKIFLNGVIQDTGDISSISNINNNGHLHLGNQYWPDTGQNAAVLDGKIYLFSMWNSALSNSKVLSVSRNEFDSSDEDLIGLWQFSEGSGNYLLDSVGVNNGQIFGATWNNNYPILGCIDQLAKNYNEEAEVDDGSCSYIIDIASDTTNFTYGGTYDGKYYYISNYETNFDTALAISASYDGYLTVISSSEENSFVVDMLSSHVEYYAHLGYYIRDNGWQWVEGESSEYTNWYATQPDDSGYQNAAIYVHNLNGRYGQWHDSNSDYYFVIESNVVPNEFSGCTDELAENYSVEAEVDNGSCIYPDNGDYSLEFSGSNQNVSVDIDFNLGMDEYTIGGFFQLDNLDTNEQTFINSTPHVGIGLSFNWGGSGKIKWHIGDGWQIAPYGSKTDWVLDQWYSFTVVKQSDQYFFYVDGELDATGTYDASDYYLDLTFGSRNDGGEPFLGQLDDFFILNKSLDQSEVFDIHSNISSLEINSDVIAYWNYNAGIGDKLYDRSGNSNHGIINGATWLGNIYGCTDSLAENYNSEANIDDGSCASYPDYRYVPQQYSTIQSAIDGSVSGDTILVASGIYNEIINFNNQSVTLISSEGNENTIIDGADLPQIAGGGIVKVQDISAISEINGFTIQNCNNSSGSGGCIRVESGSLIVKNLVVENGNSVNGGGAYFRNSDNSLIDNCQFEDNTASANGGAVFLDNSNFSITNSIFENNTGNRGGAVCYFESTSTPSLINVVAKFNDATEGGGIYVNNSNPLIENVLVNNNTAGTAGGIYIDNPDADATIDNVTIVNNIATGTDISSGGGLCSYHGAQSTIKNSIIWGNSPQQIFLRQHNTNHSTMNILYSNIQGGQNDIVVESGENLVYQDNNIDSNPEFIDADNGDFTLQSSSPCINSGDPNSSLDSDGTITEMGAYSFISIPGCVDQFSCNFNQEANTNDGSCEYECHNNGEFSLKFDNDDYVNVGNNSSFDIQSNQNFKRTILFKAKDIQSEYYANIMKKAPEDCESSSCYDLAIWIQYDENPGLIVSTGSSSDECSHGFIPISVDEKWQDYAITMEANSQNNGEKKVWVNGELVQSCNYSNNASLNTNDLIFGNGFDQAVEYLDEISIWDRVMTEEQINQFFSSNMIDDSESLLGYWKFNAGSGDILYDHSGNQNHGTIYGATWEENIYGCIDQEACNFNSVANNSDESCLYDDCSGECGGDDDTCYVTDIDGNVYDIVEIGNTAWTKQNLKVTNYSNGDEITYITDGGSWTGTNQGAYSIFNNDSQNFELYGYLYNWYAVNDDRNICPEGWHVSDDDDWLDLVEYYNGNVVETGYGNDLPYIKYDIGGKLKEVGTEHWSSPNAGATNESGFTGLPGGNRNWGNGNFDDFGTSGGHWSTDERGTNSYGENGSDWGLGHSSANLSNQSSLKNYGKSVRCVRNIYGCTDSLAENYNQDADFDDNSCEYLDNGDYSLSFDGNDDSVLIPGINGEFSEFSFLLKGYIEDIQDYQNLFYFGIEAGGDNNYTRSIDLGIDNINHNPPQLRIHLNYDYGMTGVQEFPINQWVDIAGVFDGNNQTLHLYLNGILVSSSSTSINKIIFDSSDGNNVIGAGWSGSQDSITNYFNGSISSLHLYSTVLTSDDLSENSIIDNSYSIANYKFNFGDGNVLYDYSGNQNHGTIHGATWIENVYGCTDSLAENYNSDANIDDESCQYPNYVLSFDGLWDYVQVNNLAVSNINENESKTIECWIKSSDDLGNIITNRSLDTNQPPYYSMNLGFDVENVKEGLAYSWSYGSQGYSESKYNTNILYDNNWHHVAMVRDVDLGKIRMFLDGKLIQETEDVDSGSLSMSSSTGYLQIGGWAGPGWNGPQGREVEFIDGMIDEVRISNVARYSSEFSPEIVFDSDNNTVALYHFDEGSGNQVIDYSGNGNSGTINGDAFYVQAEMISGCTDQLAANYNQEANINDGNCQYPDNGDFSLIFDGNDDYVEIENLGNQYDSENFSFLMELQFNESIGEPYLIDTRTYCHPTDCNGFYIYLSNSGQTIHYGLSGDSSLDGAQYSYEGQLINSYCQIGLIKENETLYLHLDGEIVDSKNVPSSYNTNTPHLIGKRNWGGGHNLDAQLLKFLFWSNHKTLDTINSYDNTDLVVQFELNHGPGGDYPQSLIDYSGNANHGTIYGSTWQENIYGCMDLAAFNYNEDADFDDGSCIYDPFVFNQSQNQAIYYFESVTIDGEELESNDWVGAFKDDVCVGAAKWDVSLCLNGICEIAIMGEDDTDYTTGYMQDGDIPTFKVYDASSGEFYKAESSEQVSWENLSFSVLENLNVVPDCYGTLGGDVFDADLDQICDDIDQCPFDSENDIDDDGICGDLDDCPYDSGNDIDGDSLCCSVKNQNDFSLIFDGDNDYVSIPNFKSLENFTATALIKCDIYNANFTRILDLDGGNSEDYWVMGIDQNGKIQVDLRDSDGETINLFSQHAYNDNEWHHITYVRDNTSNLLYIDGDLVDMQERDFFTFIPTGDLFFGFTDWDSALPEQHFNGIINNVSFWDDALNIEQIDAIINNGVSADDSLLVGYWGINEGSGNLINDLSGNGYDGFINGAEWIDESFPLFNDPCCLDFENDADGDGVCGDIDQCPGFDDNEDSDGDSIADGCDACPFDEENDIDGDGLCCYDNSVDNYSIYFDGSEGNYGDFVENIMPYGGISIGARFKTSATGLGRIVSKRNSNTNVYFLMMHGDGNVRFNVMESGECTTVNTFNDGNWHYALGTWDGQTVKLYIDGQLQCTDEHTIDFDYSNVLNKPFIGTQESWHESYQGYLDEVSIWDIALPANTQPYQTNPNAQGLLAYYKFDEGDGDIFNDYSGNLNHSSIIGNVDWSLEENILFPQDICCYDNENDADADGICGDIDTCPYDAENDSDGDEICGDVDECPGDSENDADSDGVCGDVDICPYDPENDADGDGLCCNGIGESTYSLEFDGQDDYVDLNRHFDLTTNFSIEIEFSPSASGYYGYECDSGAQLFMNGGKASVYPDIGIGISDCQSSAPVVGLEFSDHNNSAYRYYSDSFVELGVNNHIILTFSSGEVNVYLNSELVINQTVPISNIYHDPTSHATLGARNVSGDYMGNYIMGNYHRFSIYDKTLTSSDLDNIFADNYSEIFNNYIVHYEFDNADSSTLNDLSSNVNNGTIIGATWVEDLSSYQEDICCYDANNDSDDDGVCGDVDVCQGFDDNLDENENSYPDDCEGCMDAEGVNFDEINIFDDGTCYHGYGNDDDTYLDYHDGPNLTSFYVLPNTEGYFETSLISDFTPGILDFDSYVGMVGENSSAYYYEQIGGLIGSLLNIDRTSGYWLILNDAQDAYIEGYRTPSDIEYNLHLGNNLVSFPADAPYALGDVLPENLEGVVTKILGESNAALYEDGQWIGSLSSLDGFNGYWMVSSEDIDFSYTIPEEGLSRQVARVEKQVLPGYEYSQSSMQSFYFVKDLPEAHIGDWIISYNNDEVVGTRRWDGQMIDIPVMGYDGELYSLGYVEEGVQPSFKLYDNQTGELKELYGSIPSFINNEVFILETLTTTSDIIPGEVSLSNAYPNPFNPVTNISFTLPSSMQVEVNILDIQGRLVERVVSGIYHKGENDLIISGNNLSSGLYFIQLVTDKKVDYQKIMLLK